MRIKNQYTTISVKIEVHERLIKERDEYKMNKDIPSFSISDTIEEYWRERDNK